MIKLAIAIKRRDVARERLFAAGWKPYMAYAPAENEEHRKLLLELNAANVALTMARLNGG